MTSQQSSASEQMSKTISDVRVAAQQSSAAASQLQSSIKELEDIVDNLQTHIESGSGRGERIDKETDAYLKAVDVA